MTLCVSVFFHLYLVVKDLGWGVVVCLNLFPRVMTKASGYNELQRFNLGLVFYVKATYGIIFMT